MVPGSIVFAASSRTNWVDTSRGLLIIGGMGRDHVRAAYAKSRCAEHQESL